MVDEEGYHHPIDFERVGSRDCFYDIDDFVRKVESDMKDPGTLKWDYVDSFRGELSRERVYYRAAGIVRRLDFDRARLRLVDNDMLETSDVLADDFRMVGTILNNMSVLEVEFSSRSAFLPFPEWYRLKLEKKAMA